MEYPDSELEFYLHDNNEDAVDIVYEKYKYIIDVLISKYRRVFYALNIDIDEVKQEANLAFSSAIYSYNQDKDTSMSTFITLCVERKIRQVIKSHETVKSRVYSETLSLNGKSDVNLEDFIGDETYEPLKTVENIDTLEYINHEVKNILSSSELEVYNLMIQGLDYVEIAKVLDKTPKQIDNSIQRIRIKLKKLK